MASTSAFQAEDAGSIPVIRSGAHSVFLTSSRCVPLFRTLSNFSV